MVRASAARGKARRAAAATGFVALLFCLASGQSARYTYDDLNRLVLVDYGGGHVIRYVYDEVGNRTRLEVSFNSARPPIVTTTAAASLSTSSGIVNGSVNPLGSPATVWFDWGPTTGLGTSTAPQPVGAGTQSVAFTHPLAGLQPNTRYYYRAMASNTSGTAPGTIMSFVTQRLQNTAPVAVNDALSTTVETAATINPRANDSDVDGDGLTIVGVGAAQFGLTTLTPNDVTYVPLEGFSGVDRFSYTIDDGNGGTAQAIVTVQVRVQAVPLGSEVVVNVHTAGGQRDPRVTTAPDGRSLIAWHGAGPETSKGIFGQVFDAQGNRSQSTDIWLSQPYTEAQKQFFRPDVAHDASNNFYVVMDTYDNGGDEEIGVRSVNPALVMSSVRRLDSAARSNADLRPSVSVTPGGAVAVVWQENTPHFAGDPLAILGQRMTNLSSPPVDLPVVSDSPAWLLHPQVAAGPNTLLVVWARLDYAAWQKNVFDVDVYARLYNSAGVAQGSPFRVNTFTTGIQGGWQVPAEFGVAVDGAGNFIVVWSSIGQDGSVGGIYGQRISATGQPIGGEFAINETTVGHQGIPDVSADPTGHFAVTWQTRVADGNAPSTIAARVFYPDGTPATAEFPVSTAANGSDADPDVSLHDQSLIVTWENGECFFQPCEDIHARRFDLPGLIPKADLSITHTHTGDAIANATHASTIRVSNEGFIASPGPFVVNLTIPLALAQYADLTASIAGTDWTCSLQETGAAILASCAYVDPSGPGFTLAPGAALPEIVWSLQPLLPAVPGFTATATIAVSDVNAENNAAPDVIVVKAISDLAVVSQAPAGPLVPGAPVQFGATVTNIGPSIAGGVTLSSEFNTPVVFDQVSFAGSAQNVCDVGDPEPQPLAPPCNCRKSATGVVCKFGSVGIFPRSATFTVRPSVAGQLAATTTALPSSPSSPFSSLPVSVDPVTANNVSVASTIVAGSGDLAVTLAGLPATIPPDGILTYSVGVTNRGPNGVAGAGSTVPVPPGTTFLTASSGCALSGATVQCAWGVLNAGATSAGTFTVRASASGHGPLDANATVISTAPDPVAGNNVATARNIINRVPVANAAAFAVAEEKALAMTLTASDGDGTPLTYSVASQPAGGTVTVTNAVTGRFRYTPHANFAGADSFTFRVRDDLSFSDPATVSLTVRPVNDVPVASDAAYATATSDPIDGRLTATDADGDALTFTVVAGPSRGALSVDPNTGDFTYAPGADGAGTDEFTFKVADAATQSNVARVTISLTSNLDRWVPLGPTGGALRAFARVPGSPDTVFAGTNIGVFKSTDAGATWRHVTAPASFLGNALAVDPVSPTTVYAGGGAVIFKSVDAGETWASASAGLPSATVQSLAVEPTDPQRVYAALNTGLYVSSNGGATWTPTGLTLNGLSIRSILIDPANASVLYACTESSVFKSADRGANWTPASTGLSGVAIYRLAQDPLTGALYAATSGGVRKSTNGAGSWTSASAGITGFVLSLDMASGVVFAGTNQSRVYRSTDQGLTWTPDSGGLPASQVQALNADPTGARVLAGLSEDGVFASLDTGGSWTPSNIGLTAQKVGPLVAIPGASLTLHGGGITQTFSSVDGGAAWNSVHLPWVNVQSMAADVGNSSVLFAGFSSGVVKSTDAGATWQASSSGLTNLNIHALASLTLDVALAGTGAGVFRTTNGGATWGNPRITNRSIQTLAVDPIDPNVVYAGTQTGVYRTTDGGQTWVTRNAGIQLVSIEALTIDPFDVQIIYAGASDGSVYRTVDAGLSWALVGSGFGTPVRAVAVDPVSRRIYAGLPFGGGVYESATGTGSWTPINAGLTNAVVHEFGVDVARASLLASTDGGVFRLQRGFTLSVSRAGSGGGTVRTTTAGLVCGANCSAVFTNGRTVTLEAIPNHDSVFVSWSGDPDCSDGVVTMNGPRACTATFQFEAGTRNLVVSALATTPLNGKTASGGTLVVNDTTRNTGTRSVPASTTRYYLSLNGKLDPSDTPIGYRAVPMLAPGASDGPGAVSVTIPAGTPAGKYSLIARADTPTIATGSSAFAETSETDNTRTKAIAVGPDYTATVKLTPGKPLSGSNVTIEVTVKNVGAQAAVSPSVVQVYFSADGILNTAADVLLATRVVPALDAGASAVSSVVHNLAGVVPGTRYVFVVVDPEGAVAESSESNTIKKSFTVQ